MKRSESDPDVYVSNSGDVLVNKDIGEIPQKMYLIVKFCAGVSPARTTVLQSNRVEPLAWRARRRPVVGDTSNLEGQDAGLYPARECR